MSEHPRFRDELPQSFGEDVGMSPVAIPAWTADGVLPPINAAQPVSPERSPYGVSLTDVVLRFGQTTERLKVLDGFLNYRALLHGAGLTKGFQWLDGSFLEHIELIESRAPNDVDVVTFYHLPAGKSQMDVLAQSPEAFAVGAAAKQALKATYSVDAYVVHLGSAPERLTELSAYWYSMWSHRRNQTWKGFVQIALAPSHDAVARSTLASLGSQGGQP